MNALGRILVHLDGSPRSAERIRLARRIAQAHGAAVEAVFAVTPAWIDVPMSALGDAGGAVLLQEAEASRRRDARALFDRENTGPGPLMSWDEDGTQPAVPAFSQRALCADLLVLGQRDREDPLTWGVPGDFVPSVLADSGRPALVVPSAGDYGSVGQRVLVAWKDSRESARALSAALPLLQGAQSIDLAMWDESPSVLGPAGGGSFARTASRANIGAGQGALATPGSKAAGLETGDAGLQRLLAWLRTHGLQAQLCPQGKADAQLGEQLLSLAADRSADLLVMGCYGHTRAREWLLGGATRTVLSSMTLPVLMAH